jgi:hypothetical protein
MRTAMFAALFILTAATASAQSDPYMWVGATTTTFTGDGNGGGFVAMTTQCRTDYGATARMCSSQEILESLTLDLAAIPAAGCWIRPISEATLNGYVQDVPNVLAGSCEGWKNAQSNWFGLVLLDTGGLEGGENNGALCSVPRSVACCKPTPIPEPQASLGLPIGAVTLAALSIVKGGG